MTDAVIDDAPGSIAGRYDPVSRAHCEPGLEEWCAVDVVLRRQVTVHTLDASADDGAHDDFRARCVAVARLRHRAVPQVFDLCGGDKVMLVRQCVTAPDLAHWQPPPEHRRALRRLMSDLASGSVHLHSVGLEPVLEGPGDVRIDPDGRAVLATLPRQARRSPAETLIEMVGLVSRTIDVIDDHELSSVLASIDDDTDADEVVAALDDLARCDRPDGATSTPRRAPPPRPEGPATQQVDATELADLLGHRPSARHGPAPDAPALSRRRLVAASAGVVVLGLCIGWITRGPTTGGNASAPVAVTSVTAFDPHGDDSEHDDELAFAVDGNTATVWTTEGYRQPDFGDKPFVGLRLSVATPSVVSEVSIVTTEPGWHGEIRLVDDEELGPVVGRFAATTTQTTVRLDRDITIGDGIDLVVVATTTPPDVVPARVAIAEVSLLRGSG